MGDITIKINGVNVTAPAGSTILEAARLAHHCSVLGLKT